MNHRHTLHLITLAVLFGWLLNACTATVEDLNLRALYPSASPGEGYQEQILYSPDGTGKVYMGREISKVMAYEGAAWLERPSRALEEQPQKLLQALNLKTTDVVADIGAGTGYLSFRLSSMLPEGRVVAVDTQPAMVEILEQRKAELGVSNVDTVLGSFQDPNLPAESLDLALMVDAYHEFAYPQEMMVALLQALKPGGRVALVEYRGENPLIPIKRLHKMTERQVRREMEAVGLHWVETLEVLPQQHLLIFQKPVG